MIQRKCLRQFKDGRPCTNIADRERRGYWYCHLHDPEGEYQNRVWGMRAAKKAKAKPEREAGSLPVQFVKTAADKAQAKMRRNSPIRQMERATHPSRVNPHDGEGTQPVKP